MTLRRTILAVALLLSSLCHAQRNVLCESEASLTFDAIYRIDSEQYSLHSPRISDTALRAYLAEYQSLMSYAVANNTTNFALYQKASDQALSAAEKHTYSNTLASNLYIHRCMVEMSQGNLVTSGIQFWRSYRAFKRGETLYASYDGQLMLRGIFNILLAQIPQKWQGLAGFFGFDKGNLELGFAQIADYRSRTKDTPGVCEEALLISFANFFLSNDQRVDDELSLAMQQSPSPIVTYAYLLSLGHQQQGEKARAILATLTPKQLASFPLLYHQKAKIALRQLHLDDCVAHADTFFNTYKGATCHSDARLLKAYAHLLAGRRQQALAEAQACVQMTPTSDLDKRTQADARRIPNEDTTLLRSRFHFEYGNFSAALHALDGYTPTADHQIEYHFRLARALQMLSRTDEAKQHYDTLIALAAKDDRYFGPYSAIYMYEICLAQGDRTAAAAYVEKARKLNTGEYSKELDQRISIATATLQQ